VEEKRLRQLDMVSSQGLTVRSVTLRTVVSDIVVRVKKLVYRRLKTWYSS